MSGVISYTIPQDIHTDMPKGHSVGYVVAYAIPQTHTEYHTDPEGCQDRSQMDPYLETQA